MEKLHHLHSLFKGSLLIIHGAFVIFLLLLSTSCLATTSTDQSALVALKSSVTSDPHKILERNWTTSSSAPAAAFSVCDWVGVTCGSSNHRGRRRVTAVNISGMDLSGSVPPHLGNLTFLVSLDLSNNNFFGNLPGELSHLGRIEIMNLSFNSFEGEIPSSFGLLLKLKLFSLENNSFTGSIPPSISNMTNLETCLLSFNRFQGNIPREFGQLLNLKILNLDYNKFSGSIPYEILNISSLEVISLKWNSLSGSLPDSMCGDGKLRRLNVFNVQMNRLSGSLPSSFGECLQLRNIFMNGNNFTGQIPKGIGNLKHLQILYLHNNSLTGQIPKEIGNLQEVLVLALGYNSLTGSIPRELGNMTSMYFLFLPENKLTGAIPSEIFNISSLQLIEMTRNRLSGNLPSNIGTLSGCPSFQKISIYDNFLSGEIPWSLSQCSEIQLLTLARNNFTGSIPKELGNLKMLTELYLGTNRLKGSLPKEIGNLSAIQILDLDGNYLAGEIPRELGKLKKIEKLTLGHNYFSGSIPTDALKNCNQLTVLLVNDNPLLNGTLQKSSFGNLSNSLRYFDAYNCRLQGTIPSSITNLSSLIRLSLYGNQLVGQLPEPSLFRNLQNLESLNLEKNRLGGQILDSLCGLTSLYLVKVGENNVSGNIPECFGNNLTSLRYLHLGFNRFSDVIPLNLWNLRDLLELNLSSNTFTGSLPLEIGNLKAALTVMDLSFNQMSGQLPTSIGDVQKLETLILTGNRFEGSIPESMGKISSLESLNLSRNNFSGGIPRSLEKLQYLKYFSVSFNDLSGEIPSGGPFKNFSGESFEHNKGLCGDPKFNVPPCPLLVRNNNASNSNKKRKLLTVCIVIGVGTIMVVLALFLGNGYKKRKNTRNDNGLEVLSFRMHERISYYELLRATNGYDVTNLIGKGGFGSVYKGTLSDGRILAVKVFNLQMEGGGGGGDGDLIRKSFDVESKVLCSFRHRNLLRVISSCCNPNFKALVLEYMPNGSLEKWLYSHNYFLDAVQRLNIMIDVAHALRYLHSERSIPVVHCDLKPSNVLLDQDMVAHVSDFGIAKFLSSEDNSFTKTDTLLASLGYFAPEYGQQGIVSTKCDVYSYGIMLMEVFTRVKPTDNDNFGGENSSLGCWVNDSLHQHSLADIVDANLLNPNEEHLNEKLLDCISSVMEVALICTKESYRERSTMKDVTIALENIRTQLLQYHRVT